MTFEQLVDKCKAKEAKGQLTFFNKYYQYISVTVWRYVSEKYVAEEIVSSVFLKIFEQIHKASFENERMLLGWIRKIAINDSIAYLRIKRINYEQEIDIENDGEFITYNEGFESLALNDIIRKLDKLPIGYKTVINLSIIDGLSNAEIAKILTIKEVTVRSQLHKAKKLFSKIISDTR